MPWPRMSTARYISVEGSQLMKGTSASGSCMTTDGASGCAMSNTKSSERPLVIASKPARLDHAWRNEWLPLCTAPACALTSSTGRTPPGDLG